MPLDPVRFEETTAWFERADSDLRAARLDLDADPPLAEDALFHCQQAVEKSLKGFLTWHDSPFRRTHSLLELGLQCVDLEPSLESLLREAARLSEYATKYRCPGQAMSATKEEAAQALELAAKVEEQILARLPAEVGPKNL
jgi:HEPN domain-containing protein